VSYRFRASDGSLVHLLAVLDGHGDDGHKMSQYVGNNLPRLLERECQQIVPEGPSMDREDLEKACLRAHAACQTSLLQERGIELLWSGTTCASIVVWSGGITVCNVGDSRVVMGEFVTSETQDPAQDERVLFAARALSRDQIPLRKDERDRVKKSGCRVITIGQAVGQDDIDEDANERLWAAAETQKEGEERIYTIDPPRIFVADGSYPGYQFTRAFGDLAGQKMGALIAEPEISTKKFLSTIGLIVLATDGVFEYLTDQDVIDVASLFDDPNDACEAVVELAYRNWRDKDVRTDDITITCIHCNREHFDPMSLSLSVRNGTRIVQKPSPEDQSGLPNFRMLTADALKRYIKSGEVGVHQVRAGLRSNESFLFCEKDLLKDLSRAAN
jgi:serine/threonine protein phosphatase PrpC